MGRRKYYPEAEIKEYKGVVISVRESGNFFATVAGEYVYDTTLAGLEKELDKRLKKAKVKVALPVSQLGRIWSESPYQRGRWVSGLGVRHLTLTGIHGGTQRVLAVDDKTGEPEQLGRYSDETRIVRRLTDAEIEEYVQVETASRKAEKALRAFMNRVELGGRLDSVSDYVKAAMGLKVDEVDADAEAEAELDELLAEDPR